MNKVFVIGRLTKDADIRYTTGENAMAVARFTLAVDRHVSRNNGETTADFISCVGFGKRGEFFEKHGKKGTKFAIEGRLQTGSYKDRDGKTIYTTDVVVENVEFCESKKTEGKPQEAPSGPVDSNGFMYVPDDDFGGLPFN